MIDIKRLRELKGLTQKELAEKCNVTLRTVQNWEQGKHIPESTLILLELLGFPVKEGEIISSFVPGNGCSVSVAQGSRVIVAKSKEDPDTGKFRAAPARHQEQTTEHLTANKKRDEQIDRLLSLLENNK